MSARIRLLPHLSSDALRERYQTSHDRVESARFHALWLISLEMPREEVARLLGRHPAWVRGIVARYNAQGPEAMRDGRHHNPGAKPLLDAPQRARLEVALAHASPDGTPWSGPKVARWMSEELGHPVAEQRGWDYLRRTGHTPQSPRPRHQGGDPEAQACFPAGAAAGL